MNNAPHILVIGAELQILRAMRIVFTESRSY